MAVADWEFDFVGFPVAGAEVELGGFWDFAGDSDGDFCAVAFFNGQVLGLEIEFGIGWVGDLGPRGEDPGDACGEERAVDQGEYENQSGQSGGDAGWFFQFLEIDDLGWFDVFGGAFCFVAGCLDEG